MAGALHKLTLQFVSIQELDTGTRPTLDDNKIQGKKKVQEKC